MPMMPPIRSIAREPAIALPTMVGIGSGCAVGVVDDVAELDNPGSVVDILEDEDRDEEEDDVDDGIDSDEGTDVGTES